LRRLISPWRIAAVLAALAGLAFAVLWFVPSSDYLLLPDKAHAVAPLVRFRGEKSVRGPGGIFFLDVVERRATLLEDLFPGIRTGASVVPGSEVTPPGISERTTEKIDLRAMARSQQIAAAVALHAAGYKVVARPTGALISQIALGTPAAGRLVPGDVIVSVDGHAVRTPAEARRVLRRRVPGATVRLGVRGLSGSRTLVLKTIAARLPHTHRSVPLIGVVLDQAAQISLPFPVTIDTGNIGGPSAGLAFALEIMEKLGRKIDRGYRVAATGELSLDGTVESISGVRQKIFGARSSDVDILLVPAGENAVEARRYARHVRVIPVESFAQALHALATLPRKR
jgi:PDZ domain-containing protein